MLFVHHRKAKIAENHAFLKQRVSSKGDIHLAGCDPGQDFLPGSPFFTAREQGDAQAGTLGQRLQAPIVLPSEDLCRRHERPLVASLDDARKREKRHHRFPRPDIALQQAQHALGRGEVALDLLDRPLLRACERKRQRFQDTRADMAVADHRAARGLLHALPHQQQGKLAGKHLVIGQALASRAQWRDIVRGPWPMQGSERVGEGR